MWVPEIASRDLLSCVHTEDYLNKFLSGKTSEQEQRRTGFPWSEGIVSRCRYETGRKTMRTAGDLTAAWPRKITHRCCSPLSTGGTVLAAEAALQRGLACSTAGGTHHAFPGYGSGFCLLNDLAVAAKYLKEDCPTKRKILIVDLDVHQVGSIRPLWTLVSFECSYFESTGGWYRFHIQRGASCVYILCALWEKLPPPQTRKRPRYQLGGWAWRRGVPLHWYIDTSLHINSCGFFFLTMNLCWKYK